jgi:hypothetical protein
VEGGGGCGRPVPGVGEEGGPLVRRLQLLEPPHRTERHAPDALDEAEPEHGGNGPQLADGQRADFLERTQEQIHALELDPSFGVRDQRDRDLVHPGIARQHAGRQLGQLLVVTAGQTLPHLADVLLHHVQIVQQPFAGGAHVHVPVRRGREAVVRVVQDAAGLVQPDQQSRATAGGPGGHPLGPGEGTGPLGEMLGAQQLAANGARQEVIRRGIGSGEETGKAKRGQTDIAGLGSAPDRRVQPVAGELRRNPDPPNLAAPSLRAPGRMPAAWCALDHRERPAGPRVAGPLEDVPTRDLIHR